MGVEPFFPSLHTTPFAVDGFHVCGYARRRRGESRTRSCISLLPRRLTYRSTTVPLATPIRSELMIKRAVRIVKHLGSVPSVAACTPCGKQFTAPLTTLRRVTDPQANLQQQFDRHKMSERGIRQVLISRSSTRSRLGSSGRSPFLLCPLPFRPAQFLCSRNLASRGW